MGCYMNGVFPGAFILWWWQYATCTFKRKSGSYVGTVWEFLRVHHIFFNGLKTNHMIFKPPKIANMAPLYCKDLHINVCDLLWITLSSNRTTDNVIEKEAEISH